MKKYILSLLLIFGLSTPSFGGYPEVQKFLIDLTKNPSVKLINIGQSDSGSPIQGVAIGTGPVHTLVVATHHGNEYGGTEVAKALAASLAKDPIPDETVFVIPVLNISGYNNDFRYEKDASKIARDPNRDYPGPCGSEGPFKLKSTKALADFTQNNQIVTLATLHTYYPAVVYPWGLSTRDTSTKYDDLFKQLTQAAAQESGYPTGNSCQLIYPADGTYEDWAFWKQGAWSILFELGTSHNPSPSDVQNMISTNVPGLRRLLEQAPKTVAKEHAFEGRCDIRLKALDRHDE